MSLAFEQVENLLPGNHRLKLRIAIVVIGLLSGLAARAAVDFYQHLRRQHPLTPPAASAAPMIKAERGNR